MELFTLGLTVVRHGETQNNKDGLLQGQTIDSPLSEAGLQQAEALGRYLRDVTFTHVFVSDMLRARQTAAAVMKHNSSCSALQMLCDPLLREKSFGTAEGQPLEHVRDMARAAGQSWLDFTPPGGETEQQVRERFRQLLEAMLLRIDADRRPTGDQVQADSSPTEPQPDASPAAGRADDGVRGGVAAHALLVGHGAYIRLAAGYLLEPLRCALPPGCDAAHLRSLSPNTGVCRFIITLRSEEEGGGATVSRVRCVFAHREDHLTGEGEAHGDGGGEER